MQKIYSNTISLCVRGGLDLFGLDGEESNSGILVIQLVQGDEVGGRVLRLPALYLWQWAPELPITIGLKLCNHTKPKYIFLNYFPN